MLDLLVFALGKSGIPHIPKLAQIFYPLSDWSLTPSCCPHFTLPIFVLSHLLNLVRRNNGFGRKLWLGKTEMAW